MRKDSTLFVLLAAALLLPMGCANKKKIAAQQQLAAQQEAERLRQAEQQRIQDSIALAEAMRLQQVEQQRIQDSIAAAEAERKAKVQTMSISHMTITVTAGGQQIATPATMRWQRGTGLAISIQPFAGLEMFRMEADQQAVTVIDKINRRYTQLTYDELAQMGTKATLDDIDQWIDDNILARRNEQQLNLQLSRAEVNGAATIYTNSIQTGGNANLRPANISGYKQVTLEQMMKGF